MTSLLRDDIPVPMAEAASATITSWPGERQCARRRKADHARPYHQHLHRPAPSDLDRQPDIVLGERACRGLRARHVIELG